MLANSFVTRSDGTSVRSLDDFGAMVPSGFGAGTAPSDPGRRVAFLRRRVDNYSFAVLDGDEVEPVDLGAPDGVSWDFVPLGWFGDRVLARTDAGDGHGGAVRLVPLDGGPGTKVGVADPGTQESLTVAYRLLDAEHPTAERPEPDWPWSEERCVHHDRSGWCGRDRRP